MKIKKGARIVLHGCAIAVYLPVWLLGAILYYASKTGKYYVNAVTTSIGEDGGRRKVELGRKVS